MAFVGHEDCFAGLCTDVSQLCDVTLSSTVNVPFRASLLAFLFLLFGHHALRPRPHV